MDKKPIQAEDIVAGCIKKSEKHQELLYKKYFGYVMSICQSYSTDRSIVMEIINDCFMKVFDSINRYDHHQPFKGWLRRIAINTAIDYYRKNQKHMNHLDIMETTSESPATAMVDQLTVDDIYKLINQLPNVLKMVFTLYEVEGYSHQEIARSLAISESSSRTYLMRAKNKLRELVKRHFN